MDKKYIVGIDPDCEKSGMAIKKIGSKEFDLKDLEFWELYNYLKKHADIIKVVRVEASWLIGGNWHTQAKASPAMNARIGSKTGANHQTGKFIVTMCKELGIDVEEVKPLKKIWKSASKKISKVEFVQLTGWKGPASQEVRDAYLLIHGT